MNCQEFEKRVDELATLPISHASSPDTLLAHAENCPACNWRLETERTLSAGLKALADDERKIEAPVYLRNDLLAAFEIRGNTRAATVLKFPSASSWTRWAWAAAAAVILGFVLLASNWMRSPVTNQTASEATPQIKLDSTDLRTNGGVTTSPTNSDRSIVATVKEQGAAKVRRQAVPLNRVEIRKRNQGSANLTDTATQVATTEVKSQFVALTYMNSATAMESGIVVRVEVAREQLAALGLPLDLERADELIKADIIVGDDGVARAIRLVQ